MVWWPPPRSSRASAIPRRRAGPPPTPPGNARGRVVFLGTSLTAGLGLDPSQAYPALLQQQDRFRRPQVRPLVNAGVSGETSAGALRRIDWMLRQPVVGPGDRDRRQRRAPRARRGLAAGQHPGDHRRGAPPGAATAHRAGRACGPFPTTGSATPGDSGRCIPTLAKKNGAAAGAVPARGRGGRGRANQADMMHPSAAGQRRVAETVWPVLEPVLRGDGVGGGTGRSRRSEQRSRAPRPRCRSPPRCCSSAARSGSPSWRPCRPCRSPRPPARASWC